MQGTILIFGIVKPVSAFSVQDRKIFWLHEILNLNLDLGWYKFWAFALKSLHHHSGRWWIINFHLWWDLGGERLLENANFSKNSHFSFAGLLNFLLLSFVLEKEIVTISLKVPKWTKCSLIFIFDYAFFFGGNIKIPLFISLPPCEASRALLLKKSVLPGILGQVRSSNCKTPRK